MNGNILDSIEALTIFEFASVPFQKPAALWAYGLLSAALFGQRLSLSRTAMHIVNESSGRRAITNWCATNRSRRLGADESFPRRTHVECS
jgi:hypothetical protein